MMFAWTDHDSETHGRALSGDAHSVVADLHTLSMTPMVMATPPLALDKTMGAAYIGVVVAAAMLGVLFVQAWYYFTHQNDMWPIKLLVTAVMTFDTLHQILISHTVYVYVITNYNDPPFLIKIVWSLVVEVLFNGFTTLFVQSFLTLRVWRLSNRNIWLTSVIGLLVAAEFACVIAYTVFALRLESLTDLEKVKPLSISVNALAAAGDLLIALTLCVLLHQSRTGFRRSDTMINKLILFTVNTGFLTSLFAVASLISIVVASDTFLFMTFFFCIGRLYSNCLLATLNAREMIRGSANGIQSTSISLPELPKRRIFFSRRNMPDVSIKVDTTRKVAIDSNQRQEFRDEAKRGF